MKWMSQKFLFLPPRLPQEMMSFQQRRILTNQRTYGVCNTNNFPKQDKFSLEEKARIFVQSVAGGLLEKIGRKSKKFFSQKKKKKIFLGNMKEQKKIIVIATSAVTTTFLYRNAKEFKI